MHFNLGCLQKHKFKVFFIAISKIPRARMMKFCIQAHLNKTKRLIKKIGCCSKGRLQNHKFKVIFMSI